MFSKNIILQNFKLKKNRKHTKKLNQIFKKELINSSSLLNSYTTKYNYSFKKILLKSTKITITLI